MRPHRHDPMYALHNGAAIASNTCASDTDGQSTSGGVVAHIASSTAVALRGIGQQVLVGYQSPGPKPLITAAIRSR